MLGCPSTDNFPLGIYLLTLTYRIEGAVKQILCGMNVKTSASVANAGCLEWYRQWSSTN